MKKFLLVAALFAFSLGSVHAQYPNRHDYGDHHRYDRPDYGPDRNSRNYNKKNQEVDHLQRDVRRQIEVGINRRTLTTREASRLKQEYGRIAALEQKFSHRGRLSNREVRILKDQLHKLMADTQRLNRNYRDHRAGQYRGHNQY
ncbi:hypothetical protein [Dyadobacter tibetensis]|uniref:hypothetical protein n=1 Tax=Dyadobacter tibetensis TaxID=1211851 RepID=UPI0004711315|nr:hypothetical protein [Dyadobacter tibetensis]